MNKILKAAFEEEMRKAKLAYNESDWDRAFAFLERAHVLGQRNAVSHTVSHWWMMKVALRRGDAREILGQTPRLLFGGLTSFLGRAPIGNTGGANVPIMQPMPIAKELQDVFDEAEASLRRG